MSSNTRLTSITPTNSIASHISPLWLPFRYLAALQTLSPRPHLTKTLNQTNNTTLINIEPNTRNQNICHLSCYPRRHLIIFTPSLNTYTRHTHHFLVRRLSVLITTHIFTYGHQFANPVILISKQEPWWAFDITHTSECCTCTQHAS